MHYYCISNMLGEWAHRNNTKLERPSEMICMDESCSVKVYSARHLKVPLRNKKQTNNKGKIISPDGAKECIDLRALPIFGPQEEDILCLRDV